MREINAVYLTAPLVRADGGKTSLPLRQPSVDREFFQATVNCLAALNVDFAAACRRHGVTNPLLLQGDRVPLELVSRSYDAVYAELGSPAGTYTLAAAMALNGARTVALENLFACCGTLEEALRLACRYAAIVSDVCSFTLRAQGEHIDLVLTPARGAYVSTLQMECALYIVRKYILVLRGGERAADAVRVLMMQEPAMAISHYERIFACPVCFGQAAFAIRMRPDVLATVVPGADARKAAFFAGLVERHTNALVAQGDLAQRVQRLFMHHMAFGELTRETLAEKLNISVRTMQRQLLAAGTGYRELVDGVRFAVATGELRQPERRASEVALLLGYGDARSFFRAFRRWTGMSPRAWRVAQG